MCTSTLRLRENKANHTYKYHTAAYHTVVYHTVADHTYKYRHTKYLEKAGTSGFHMGSFPSCQFPPVISLHSRSVYPVAGPGEPC